MVSSAQMSSREQRKAETRGALVSAAQTLIAERRTTASIRDIITMAGVGFGSFFNYFETKDELFDAAFVEAMEAYGEVLTRLVGTIADPAEGVSAALRVTGRLQRRMPMKFTVMMSHGMLLMLHERGLDARFRARVTAGNALGQFDCPDIDRSILAVGGAMLGVLHLLDLRPERDAALETDEFTRRTLVSMGVPPGEAVRLVALPLPEIPDDVTD